MLNKFNDDAKSLKSFRRTSDTNQKSKKIILLPIAIVCILVVITSLILKSQNNSDNYTNNENLEETTDNVEIINTDTSITTTHKSETAISDNTISTSLVEDSLIPNDAIQYDGHYYKGFTNGVSWIEAEQACNDIGGHLISINSQEEMNIALSIAKELNKDNIWIGGRRSGNSWVWSDGSEFIYQNWDIREVIDSETNETIIYEQPDDHDGVEDYIRFPSRYIEYPENYWWANEGKWNDTANNGDMDAPLNSFGYICEWD